MQYYSNASLIFPPIPPIPQILGEPRLRTEVLTQIETDPTTLATFQALSPIEQDIFLDFCMGNRGLKISYDPFFLHLFNPSLHPGRLERLISCILGQDVNVRKILPRERQRISESSSLIIMDILVQLSDERLVNVEMQRIGYDFPIERGFCYGADLIVRQYDMVKKEKGDSFSYHNIMPVYIIVLMEQSPGIFWKYPDQYLHRSIYSFDTGLKLKPLLNFIYISLDIFNKMRHNKLTELEAWLCFLSSDDPADILHLIQEFPFFREYYNEIIQFRYHPKELITMFSDALRIMDENAVKYMVDEMKAEISRQKAEISDQKAKISNQETEIARLRAELARYQK